MKHPSDIALPGFEPRCYRSATYREFDSKTVPIARSWLKVRDTLDILASYLTQGWPMYPVDWIYIPGDVLYIPVDELCITIDELCIPEDELCRTGVLYFLWVVCYDPGVVVG